MSHAALSSFAVENCVIIQIALLNWFDYVCKIANPYTLEVQIYGWYNFSNSGKSPNEKGIARKGWDRSTTKTERKTRVTGKNFYIVIVKQY